MPIKQEMKYKRQARGMGLKGRAANAFVFGKLRKMGWKPRRERRGKRGKR